MNPKKQPKAAYWESGEFINENYWNAVILENGAGKQEAPNQGQRRPHQRFSYKW